MNDVEVRLITAMTILKLWLSMNIICRSPFSMVSGLGIASGVTKGELHEP